jgi:hypothetical protein
MDRLGSEGTMPLRLSLPKFRKAEASDAADEDVAPALPTDEADDKSGMRKRRVLRLTTIVFVALAAGQYVQSTQKNGGTNAVAATTRDSAQQIAKAAQVKAVLTPVIMAKAEVPRISAGVAVAGMAPVVQVSATAEAAVPVPTVPVPATPAPVVATPTCSAKLDLAVEPGALLGLSLVAPCHPDERVLLRHAGLTVTGKTNAAGSLFLSLPALTTESAVEAAFADGTKADASVTVPELAAMRRIAVQWQGSDNFALHGLEDGADFAQAGDISANNPGQQPTAAAIPSGGWMVAMGDATVDNPMLAEVYTYPAVAAGRADIAIEAAVTASTCGRDMLGQTLASTGGAVSVTDLTLSMPACDGQSGYLVLKNLFPDMKIASGN